MLRINEYHRPQILDDALALLQRDETTVPLAGGTHLLPSRAPGVRAVVDLQALGLDRLSVEGFHLHLGAMVPLQRLVETPGVGELLAESARLEGPLTYRNSATIGGIIATGDPLSHVLIALLALEAEVHLRLPDPATVSLDRILDAPAKFLEGGLITGVTALSAEGASGTAMARVARTPRDRPIVAVAVRVTREEGLCGGVRIALAGVADRPIRAYEAEDRLKGQPFDKRLVDVAAATLGEHLRPPSDFKGSSEYRREMAAVLTRRALLEACEKLV
ncbi:MAG: xanthine dehydrogenase family protein subunit M [Anaerolineae bacterium]